MIIENEKTVHFSVHEFVSLLHSTLGAKYFVYKDELHTYPALTDLIYNKEMCIGINS